MFWASSGIERGKSAGLVSVRGAPMSTAGSWAWYERARAHGGPGTRVTSRPGVRRAGMRRRRPGRPPLAVHRDGARRGARGIRRPDCRALARTVTTSPATGHLPAGAGGSPGARLRCSAQSGCTGGTQPPGGIGKRLACQEHDPAVRYCCPLPTGSPARRASPPFCSRIPVWRDAVSAAPGR